MMRRGFTLWEVLTACCMLVVLLTLILQFTIGVTDDRCRAAQRETALQEAASVMEHFTAPRQGSPAVRPGDMRLSAEAAERLPHGELEVKEDAPAGTPPASRVLVTVRWQPRPAEAPLQVRLVAWKQRTTP